MQSVMRAAVVAVVGASIMGASASATTTQDGRSRYKLRNGNDGPGTLVVRHGGWAEDSCSLLVVVDYDGAEVTDRAVYRCVNPEDYR